MGKTTLLKTERKNIWHSIGWITILNYVHQLKGELHKQSLNP